jgi:hypothetical protein
MHAVVGKWKATDVESYQRLVAVEPSTEVYDSDCVAMAGTETKHAAHKTSSASPRELYRLL